ncbi:hypothetical protein BDW71DRAFT_184511 [Aspergillus fruticulosus]
MDVQPRAGYSLVLTAAFASASDGQPVLVGLTYKFPSTYLRCEYVENSHLWHAHPEPSIRNYYHAGVVRARTV